MSTISWWNSAAAPAGSPARPCQCARLIRADNVCEWSWPSELRPSTAVAPARVLLRQAQDQDSHGSDGARLARAVRSGHAGVASAYKVAVPTQDGVRAYQQAESV